MPDNNTQRPVPILLMSYGLGHGGGERQLAQTALRLDRKRFEPHVACCLGGFWERPLRDQQIPLYFLGPRSFLSGSIVREWRRLHGYLRDNRIRIVQSFDYSMNVLGMPVALATRGVIPISNLRCHMELIPARYRWINHLVHRFSPAVVVNSEALRRHLVGNYNIQDEKVFTCHNGLDADAFHPGLRQRIPGLEGASLVIGSLCVLRAEKNLGLLLDTFAVLASSRPGIRLLIVGSGPEESSLRSHAERLGITAQCVFHPSTPDVLPYLSSMDIFVLPSLSEGFSNALMEAMAAGCCAVASRVGGNSEMIEDGVTGLLFESENLDSLVSRLSAAADDACLRNGLAAAGSQRTRSGFSLDRAAERMQQIYEAALRC